MLVFQYAIIFSGCGSGGDISGCKDARIYATAQQILQSQYIILYMLVYGTCNPEGYGDSSYEGLYLTDTDIQQMTPSMAGVPVKIEHRGVDVGKVVTAWVHQVFSVESLFDEK